MGKKGLKKKNQNEIQLLYLIYLKIHLRYG